MKNDTALPLAKQIWLTVLFLGVFAGGAALLGYLLQGSRLLIILDALLDNPLGVLFLLALPFIILGIRKKW